MFDFPLENSNSLHRFLLIAGVVTQGVVVRDRHASPISICSDVLNVHET